MLQGLWSSCLGLCCFDKVVDISGLSQYKIYLIWIISDDLTSKVSSVGKIVDVRRDLLDHCNATSGPN